MAGWRLHETIRRSTAWRGPGKACSLAGAAFLLIVPAIAWAADLPARAPAPDSPAAYAPATAEWIVTIGGELRIGPKWPGATDRQIRPHRRPAIQRPQGRNAA